MRNMANLSYEVLEEVDETDGIDVFYDWHLWDPSGD